jgi:bacteriorhodopsin
MSLPFLKLALILSIFATPAAAQYVEQLNDTGNNALWVAFFGLFIPTVYFYYSTMQQPEGKRYFHVLTTAITAIASLAYLVMAMGYGVVDVGGRPFFYARCTTPSINVNQRIRVLCYHTAKIESFTASCRSL